jgi:hypothetical protein
MYGRFLFHERRNLYTNMFTDACVCVCAFVAVQLPSTTVSEGGENFQEISNEDIPEEVTFSLRLN